VGLLDCARRLNLALNTVKRYARVPEPDRLIRAPAFRPTLVDPYRDYLRRRRAEEPAVSVLRLFREITEQGYTGSHNLLVRYINQGRLEGDKPAISPRALTRLLLTRPDALTDAQRNRLGELTATCPEMTLLASLIRDFAALLDPADGNDDHLATWITNARTADLPHLHAFTRGLAPAAASAQQFTRGSPTNSPRRNDRAHLRDSTRAKPPSIRAPRASNSERHRSGSTLGHTATGRSSRVHTTPEDHRWPLSFPDRLPLSPATQPQPTRPQRSQKSGWSTNARRAGEIKARKMI